MLNYNGFIKESNQENNKSGYYISTGEGEKRFTLRYWFTGKNASGEEVIYDNHIETYGQNLEEAKEKAKNKLGYIPEIRATAVGKITKELTYQHMPNGKYEGKHFTEVPISYLSWWIENYADTKSYQKIIADIKKFITEKEQEKIKDYKIITFGKYKDTDISKVPSEYLDYLMSGSDIIVRGAAKLELERRGELIDGKSQITINKEDAEKTEKERQINSEWVGKIGEKIEIELKVLYEFNYESQYGTTYITKFIDKDGNTIIYKGKSLIDNRENLISLEKIYQIKDDNVIELPNPYKEKELTWDKIKLPKYLYQIGVDYRKELDKYVFHTWHGDRAKNEVEIKNSLRNLEKAGNLPKCNYVDDKLRLYLIKYSDNYFIPYKKGAHILISCTISKHDEYKEEKQTYIQRLKFIKEL